MFFVKSFHVTGFEFFISVTYSLKFEYIINHYTVSARKNSKFMIIFHIITSKMPKYFPFRIRFYIKQTQQKNV